MRSPHELADGVAQQALLVAEQGVDGEEVVGVTGAEGLVARCAHSDRIAARQTPVQRGIRAWTGSDALGAILKVDRQPPIGTGAAGCRAAGIRVGSVEGVGVDQLPDHDRLVEEELFARLAAEMGPIPDISGRPARLRTALAAALGPRSAW